MFDPVILHSLMVTALVTVGIGIVAATVLFLGAPFLLSSRISREEEAEEYRRLVGDLNRKPAEAAANDHAGVRHLVSTP